MKKLLPALCLTLSACSLIPGLGSGSGSASTPAPTGTTTLSAGVQGATPTTQTDGSAAVPVSTPTATKTVSFDTSKKLEYVDIYVDMTDPSGQRALVPYLLKPKDWMLIGCDMTSTTSKHYRFMRVSTADGQALPEVDIFKQGR